MPDYRHLIVALAATLTTLAVAHLAHWITPTGMLAGAVLLGAAWLTSHLRRVALTLALFAFGLGVVLTLHLWPGFANPAIWQGRMFCSGCLPHSLYLPIDQALLVAAWLPLLAGIVRRGSLPPMLIGAAATIAASATLGLWLGVFRWQPSWPGMALLWFAGVNLVIVAAEEVLFRGLLQRHILHRLGAVHAWWLTALFFGLAHLPFGAEFAAVATVAGLGYGYVAWQSGSLWPAIGLHWAVNLLHFSLFSYPLLA
ncbi:MAG: CPBP family intramembrane glutamic endopeptidase [Guyparkeria sp.]|uniref:CPBP family intramembrane glutamic endopeptidase n=1 Tax=Guyparkeria sp. TaxID=2035736 RepID=UPI00397E905B